MIRIPIAVYYEGRRRQYYAGAKPAAMARQAYAQGAAIRRGRHLPRRRRYHSGGSSK